MYRFSLLFFILLISLFFSSCKKDEVIKTVELEKEDIILSWWDSLYLASENKDEIILESVNPKIYGDLKFFKSKTGKLDSIVFGTNNAYDSIISGAMHYDVGDQYFIAIYNMQNKNEEVSKFIDTVNIWYAQDWIFYNPNGTIKEIKQQVMVKWINWSSPTYQNHYSYFLKEN